jgi:hypothetical protein
MQYAFVIAATGVAGSMLYQTVNKDANIESLKAKIGPKGAKINIQFTKPQPGEGQVRGSISVPKTFFLADTDLRTELQNDLNKVDGAEIGNKTIRVTSWVAQAQVTNLTDDADHFGVVVQNETSHAMYAQLFQGFQSSADSPLAVAWAMADYTIANGDTATAEWAVQYVMVAGQKGGSKFSVGIDPIDCKLGDAADVVYNPKTHHVSVTKSATPGQAGTITFNVADDFPDNSWYVGFGIRDPDTGKAKASGVALAFAAASFSFTPYERYSVNLVNNETTNLYELSTVTKFEPFEFTHSSNRWAKCVFDTTGWLPPVYSVGPFLKDNSALKKLVDDVEKVEITTKRQIKQVIIQYV